MELRDAQVNGRPGTLAYAPDGSLVSVLVYDVIRALRNPSGPPGVSPA